MEIGHNEIGDADAYDEVNVPPEISSLVEFLALPPLGAIHTMKLEYQVAQKLHGATERNSRRPHDLIDLQLIVRHHDLDMDQLSSICHQLFTYRKCQPWPSKVVKNEGWEDLYLDQRNDLPVLPTVDEAIAWTNDLIARIK